MKAVTFHEFGGPEKLRIDDHPAPPPGPGEVVVRVAAASINPTDLLMLKGAHAALMAELKPPFVAGMEYAGHVAATGDGVELPAGATVIGVVNPRRPTGGAQAQEICVSAKSVAPVAAGTDLIKATTVPMNVLTAIMALDLLGLSPGQSLLVTGGGGSMGGYAIELARRTGLNVLANAGEKDREFLTALCVDTILPRDEGLEDALRAVCPEGVDGLIDGALIGKKVSSLVRDGGGAVSLRSSYVIDDPRLTVSYVSVGKGIEDSAKIARIAKMLEAGQLTPRVAPQGVFPFAKAVDAYRMAERGGFRGRAVMTFD